MRRKTANRAIALLLTIVMALGLCGTSVFAVDGDPLESKVTGGSYTDPSVEAGKTYEYTIVDDITGETATVLATASATADDVDVYYERVLHSVAANESITGLSGVYAIVGARDGTDGQGIINSNRAVSNADGYTYVTVTLTEVDGKYRIVGENSTIEWTINEKSNSIYTIQASTREQYLYFSSSTADYAGLNSSDTQSFGILKAGSYTGVLSDGSAVYIGSSSIGYLNNRTTPSSHAGVWKDADRGSCYSLYKKCYFAKETSIDAITSGVLTEDHYTSDSWTAYATALENAKQPYDTQNGVIDALNNLQAARDALEVKPDMLFTVTTEADYNGGTVSSENLTATATPNDGQRFCYWLKDGAYYSSEATITVTDTNSVYTAWFIAETGDDSIRVPITWQRTDEQTTDSDGDGSKVVTGIDTYASYPTDWTQGNVSYGVEWDDIKELTVTSHPYVWDFEQTGTDGDGVGYQYGAYTNDNSYEKSVVAATWKDLDQTDTSQANGWKYGSARLFRGTFYWPEGYSTSDIVKMVSVNDANYQFIYDYINNSGDEELKAAYAGGSVIPINDDMFVFIHRVEDDLSKEESAEALRYLDFFTGTTGKGAWSYAGVSGNDWAKTEETLLGTQFSSRAFRWSWPNLTETNSEVVSFQNDTAHPDYKQALAHTDGWYTILNTSALSSKLSDVYGANMTFAAGQQFYFDIYCIDNDGSGGMDKWELTFKKSPQTVTVNYYYASVTDPMDDEHFLGSAQITGKVTGDQITLPGTTAAAGLNYLLDAARTKAGSDYTCTGGVQQGTVPYVVKAGENVIDVLYVPVAKSGIQLVSNGAQYVYNGSEQTASGITLYADGKEVTPTSANKWVVKSVTLSYMGTGSVSQTYVGNYPNTIQFENGKYTDLEVSDESGLTFVAPVIGTLTITPVTDFVIDYGLPLDITPSNMGYDPKGDTVFTLGDAVLQYGDAALGNSKKTLTYTPNKTVDGVESIPVSGLVGAGGYTYSGSINIIPATNVLYEESFASTSNEQAVKWTKEGTAAQLQQQTAYPGMTGANVYGYDDAYVADQENSAYSNGSAWKATVNEACQGLNYASNCPKAEFTFTGTGFDIYSECGADTGMLFVTVRNAETNAAVAGYMVDTLFNGTFYTAGDNGTVSVDGGMVYQIPVVHNADLTYGTYKVTVYGYYVNRNVDATPMSVSGADDAVTAESLAKELGLDDVGLQFVYMDKSSPLATLAAGGAIRRDSDDGAVTFAAGAEQIVYLDGFRVYNPLGTATLSVAAQNAYTGDSEINPTYVSLFKVLMEQSEQNQNVLVFVEKSGETYTLNNEYQIKSGPQNEIYLKPGQSVAFTATSSRVMVSAKTINGETKMNAVTITSGTEQYFELTGTGNTYTITNNGDKILSLVNLKLIDGAMTTVGADTYTAIATALGAPVTLQDGTVVEPEKPEPVEPEWVNPYDDVHQQDWFYEYVKYVTQHGLMNGMGDRKFAPKTVMNRAMLATVLYRIAGEPEVSGEMPFSDVATGEWYSDAILWAVQNGVVEGVGGGKFAPDEPLTREQMVTMLYRYWKLSNPDAAAAGETDAQFIDWDLVSDWALEAMRWAVANGQIHGMTAETLSPQGSLPREQAATLLARYDRLVSGK